MKNSKGFTLIEIVVAIAVIAILSGIGAVYANRYLPVYRLREATRDMASTLQQARLEAIKRSNLCVVTYNVIVGGVNFDYFSFVDNNQNFQFDAGEPQLSAVQLANYRYVNFGAGGVTFPNNANGDPSIGFNNRGLSLNSIGGFGAGTVNLQNTQGRLRQVVVNAAGNVRVQ